MEDFTLDEACQRIHEIEADLARINVHPYAVALAHEDDAYCDENLLDEFVAVDITVSVDIAHNGVQPSEYIVREMSDWDYSRLLELRCGLVDLASPAVLARIAFWNWDKPAQWRAHRALWRQGCSVIVDACQRDKEQARLIRYGEMKRKLDIITEVLDVPVNKKQRRDDGIHKTKRTDSGV